MKLKQPKNENYSAIVTKIQKIIPLNNCDNVVHALVLGQYVIVDKSHKENDLVLYFPVECQLSKEFVFNNNLYRNNENNINNSKKGFFEDNRRVRCVKFRGNYSQGFVTKLNSLNFTGIITSSLQENDLFDEINGIPICNKYKKPRRDLSAKDKANKKKKENNLVNNQFNFHYDTAQLYRNLHKVNKGDLVSITAKIHGSSFIVSRLLKRKQMNFIEKILMKFGIKIQSEYYDDVYASRRMIKKNNNLKNSYYKQNIWKDAYDKLKPFLINGITFYGEIFGYAGDKYIQKDYDYGCKKGENKIAIYRITYTNTEGKVFEFSAKQVQEYCKKYEIPVVKELYYGYINEDIDIFVENVFNSFVKGNDHTCKNKVPKEGVVIRIENKEAKDYTFKFKNPDFLEYETKILDKEE